MSEGLLGEMAWKIAGAGLASSSGANGWVLLKSWLPDSTALAHKAVALIETGGHPPMLPVELDYPTFQVKVRGDISAASSGVYSDARAEAEALKLLLHGLGGETMPDGGALWFGYSPSTGATAGRYYVSIAALQEPALMHYDPVQRPVLVFNCLATRSRTANVPTATFTRADP